MKNVFSCIFSLLLILSLPQVADAGSKGKKDSPPPWAPAHGVRAKHKYQYYPDHHVYFDIERKVYFYLDGGTWRMAAKLPFLSFSLSDSHVAIEVDTEKPYIHFEQHKVKYPGKKEKVKKKYKRKGK